MCSGIIGKIFGCKFVHIYDRYYKDYTPSSGEITEMVMDDMYIESVIEALRIEKTIYIHSICKRCGNVIKADFREERDKQMSSNG